jgi:hypothetical protein
MCAVAVRFNCRHALRGEIFLISDSGAGDTEILRRNVEVLCASRALFTDSGFETAPALSMQLRAVNRKLRSPSRFCLPSNTIPRYV